MRNIRFWLPAIIGVFLTPIFFYLLPYLIPAGSGHAGAGMVQLLVVYPLPLLTMMFLSGKSSDAFLSQALAMGAIWVQFPLYGFIISYANLRKSLWLKICAGLVWVHLIAIAAFVIIFVIQTRL
jgi:hypothetical protein